MIIQIFTEKYFSSSFWIADPLNKIEPSIFSYLRDLYTGNPLVVNKYTKNIKWGGMRLNDAPRSVFLEIDKKLLTSAKESHEKWSNV